MAHARPAIKHRKPHEAQSEGHPKPHFGAHHHDGGKKVVHKPGPHGGPHHKPHGITGK